MSFISKNQEKQIAQVKRVNAKKHDFTKIDMNTVEDDQNDENEKLLEASVYFEELYKNTLDMTRNTVIHEGRYQDANTEVIYRAFKIALKEQRKGIFRGLGRIKQRRPSNNFILGIEVKDNTVQFGYRPFVHKTIEKAKDQAAILNDRLGKTISIYEKIEVVGDAKEKTPVEETRQKQKGRLVRSPFLIFNEVIEIKGSGVKLEEAPNSIHFEGKEIVLSFLNSAGAQRIIRFNNFQELCGYTDDWIKNFKKELKEQS